jgi:hypothetical protein
MQPRFVALVVLAVALVGCDAGASSTAETTPSVRPSASGSSRAGSAVPGSAAPATSAPAATTEPPASTVAPTAAPRTNPPPPPPPPPSVAKVSVLPGNTGTLGSTWLLSISGFAAGRVVATITNPAGIPRSQFLTTGADGSASMTFQTTLSDQPGVGRYIFRFDGGGASVSTSIEVTRPE